MEFSQPAREQHLCSKLNLMATGEKSGWISGRTYRSSFNCEQTREVKCCGTRRITLVFYRKRAFKNECACTMLWRAFDKTVRRKPLAGAADAGCYGNSIDFCLKSLARRGV